MSKTLFDKHGESIWLFSLPNLDYANGKLVMLGDGLLKNSFKAKVKDIFEKVYLSSDEYIDFIERVN